MDEEKRLCTVPARRSRKIFIVKIKYIANGHPCGSVYDREDEEPFNGLFDLIKIIDDSCEYKNGPQRRNDYRTFGNALNARKAGHELLKLKAVNRNEIKNDDTDKKAFVLRIEVIYRCNVSMQGRISLTDIAPISFRSAFELMLLINEIVEKAYEKSYADNFDLSGQQINSLLSVQP